MLTDTEYGKGIKIPIQLDGKGDLANVEGDELLLSDVELLCGIERGELAWDLEQGTRFREMLHRKIQTLIQNAVANRETSDVLNRYEPRAWAGKAMVEKDGNLLRVYVRFRRRGSMDTGDEQVATIEVRP
jgi:hypothetical protein